MRKFSRPSAWLLGSTLWLSVLPLIARPLEPQGNHASPQDLFGELFVAVQGARIFTDSKVFPDAIADSSPADIVKAFQARRPNTAAALEEFVAAHFVLPAELPATPTVDSRSTVDSGPTAGSVSIVEHIDGLWTALTRSTPIAQSYSSLLALPRPYVVPGGRFRELYYWDSYFTMLGLAESGRQDLVADMVRDFAYLIDTYGHVPNGARTYYLSRSQPPFFFAMVGLLEPDDPDAAFAKYLPQLRREYFFWMQGAAHLRPRMARRRVVAYRRVVALPDGSVLNRFWDDRDEPRDESYFEDTQLARISHRAPGILFREIRAAAESGWDFSSRWFADGMTRATLDTSELLPIDLNSLLYGLENAISGGCRRNGDMACVRDFARRAANRRHAIDKYLWHAAAGIYQDYRWTRRSGVPRASAAAVFPLFVSLASASQAAAVANLVSRELLAAGGIVATPVTTGEQWDSPNGWAPLQWIAVAGLRAYGHAGLAARIACRWIANVNGVYARSGKLVEKYDVVNTDRSGGGGEYPLQDGFGWTNGVTRRLISLYPDAALLATPAHCH